MAVIPKTAVEDTLHPDEILERASAPGRTTTSIVPSSPVQRKPLLMPPFRRH
ncbi:hypothetical protein [Streptomyces sp900116325]|uniref:hypothetical protein n=1 Tax=Streptomyces sp. 900116325 TaxID=3154295 RepID=UPI0033BABA28